MFAPFKKFQPRKEGRILWLLKNMVLKQKRICTNDIRKSIKFKIWLPYHCLIIKKVFISYDFYKIVKSNGLLRRFCKYFILFKFEYICTNFSRKRNMT